MELVKYKVNREIALFFCTTNKFVVIMGKIFYALRLIYLYKLSCVHNYMHNTFFSGTLQIFNIKKIDFFQEFDYN